MADGTDMNFDAETVTHRAGFAKLRSLTKINPRLAPNLARTMLGGQRDHAVVEAFNAHAERAGFEFTSTWASNNIPFVAPLLRDLPVVQQRESYQQADNLEFLRLLRERGFFVNDDERQRTNTP